MKKIKSKFWACFTPSGQIMPSTIREKPGDVEGEFTRREKHKVYDPKLCSVRRVYIYESEQETNQL